ncbi:MAG TPA: hypothetical protein VFA18_14000, partial [Gemmataceae bacterium]|nr:hypothetical protein [Gemmataceae bacterium]
PLVREHQENPDYAVELAGLYVNWGSLLLTIHHNAFEGARRCTQAVHVIEAVLRREPRYDPARMICRNAHGERAYNYEALARYTEAIEDWDRVIELDGENERPAHRALRGWTFLHAGDHARAAATAGELAHDPKTSDDILYEAAKLAAVAAKSVQKDPQLSSARRVDLAKRYEDEAIYALERLKQKGSLRSPSDLLQLRQESAFANLHDRPDFKALTRP